MSANDRKKEEIVPILFTMHKILCYMAHRSDFIHLKEICNALDIPRSTANRILFSLYQLSHLEKHPNKPYYRFMQNSLLTLPLLQIQRERLRKAAQGVIDKLAENLGETTKISIWQQGSTAEKAHVEVLCIANGNNKMHIHVLTGTHFPYHAGAASKVLMAFQPRILEKLFHDSNPLERFTENTITDTDTLKKELSQIQNEGFAYDHQEYLEGIEAIACPIFSPMKKEESNTKIPQKLLGALSVPHIAKQGIRERIHSKKSLLVSAANDIGRNYFVLQSDFPYRSEQN